MKPCHWRGLVLLVAVAPTRPVVAQDTIQVRITNQYFAYVNVGIGNAHRAGADTLTGDLILQSNGTWQGEVDAKVTFKQAMRAFGIDACPLADYTGTQRLLLRGTNATGFNPVSQTISYSAGTADGGFLEIAVEPVEPAAMNSTNCLTLYEDVRYNHPLLPLNDARWTQPTSGYVIGIPQNGVLEYRDGTVQTFQTNIDLSRPAEAVSSWTIRVERR